MNIPTFKRLFTHFRSIVTVCCFVQCAHSHSLSLSVSSLCRRGRTDPIGHKDSEHWNRVYSKQQIGKYISFCVWWRVWSFIGLFRARAALATKYAFNTKLFVSEICFFLSTFRSLALLFHSLSVDTIILIFEEASVCICLFHKTHVWVSDDYDDIAQAFFFSINCFFRNKINKSFVCCE